MWHIILIFGSCEIWRTKLENSDNIRIISLTLHIVDATLGIHLFFFLSKYLSYLYYMSIQNKTPIAHIFLCQKRKDW